MKVNRMAKKRRMDNRKDYYFKLAKKEGYRSRASYKLKQINKKYNIFKGVSKVLDLCCSPGSWSQVILEEIPDALVVSVDLVSMSLSNPQIRFIKGDITSNDVFEQIYEVVEGSVDLIVSDCSPKVSGIWTTDHARQIFLAEYSFKYAQKLLVRGGTLVMKVFQGDLLNDFINEIKQCFDFVKIEKPPASRKSSAEIYIVAKGFNKCSIEY